MQEAEASNSASGCVHPAMHHPDVNGIAVCKELRSDSMRGRLHHTQVPRTADDTMMVRGTLFVLEKVGFSQAFPNRLKVK